MESFFGGFGVFTYWLRMVLFYLAAIAAIVCLVDWLARTRRISPFNPIARFMRTTVDPLMRPIEARIVRAGGMPTSAPWWTLVFIVVTTIVLISFLEFLRGQMLGIAVSSQLGVRGIFILLVRWTFGILRLALIVRIISSWFGMSPYSRWIRWSYQLTEPIMAPLRQVVPTIGVIDITPIIAWFLLSFLQWITLSMLGAM